MENWQYSGPVFDTAPAWTFVTIPGFKGHIWAPDIIFHNEKYYVYYSVSAFGKNTSCIGVATNKTLHRSDPEYKWQDHGIVVQSIPGRDLWNAIDPNITLDENGTPWMVFGSFWEGMKLVKLNPNLTEIAVPEEWYTVAKRSRSPGIPDPDPGDGAIEAPFIFKKNDYYYLFVSFDYCCRGINSNYKIMVGRSEKVMGPYFDREGKAMFEGGGTLVLKGNDNWPGVGHNSVYTFNEKDYIVYHAYDASENGKPKLHIRELSWDTDGWPVVNNAFK
jgi:arabinan endo-1,5-alpha-L-arabinosidase